MSDIILADISKWQGRVDWLKFFESGLAGVIIRAGSCNAVSGAPYTDYQFDYNAAHAPNIPRGFYWYFRPAKDAVAQAEYFMKLVKPLTYPYFLAIDIEENENLQPSDVTRAVSVFSKQLTRLGKRQLIYSSPSFIGTHLIVDDYIRTIPLWIANWDVTRPRVPSGWKEWTLWQYTSTADGRKYGAASRSIDLNYWHGTLDELQAFAGIAAPEPELSDKEKLDRLWSYAKRQGWEV